MELFLLGPTELRVAGRAVPLGGARQRAVLAALAVDTGTAVPAETLIDRVWGDDPPPRVRHALQVYVARIRRLLRGGSADPAPAQVVSRSGGYMLDVDPERVDMHRFRRLVWQARAPERPDPDRLSLLGEALDLWRGPALADLPGRWPSLIRQGWQQQHLEVAVTWAALCLQHGSVDTVLAELGQLAGEHPMVESLAAAMMRALYLAGRPSDALREYERVQRLLAEELGTDPGHELRQLHRQLLTADPALGTPRTSGRSLPVPRQLPAAPPQFVGRAQELAALDRRSDGATVVITAIDGMAGIGKTALAVHAAHRMVDRFPDGQLFIDLHGYTEGLAPSEPAEALDRLLRDLGVPGTQVPAGLDQRASLYRSRLADQQMLIVLDNAASEAQVAPLLPGAAGCLVLVTSRRRLAGLDRTRTLSLDALRTPDAVALFARAAGQGQRAGQPAELVAELVELCGRLPLAIQIAAARLRSHPAWHVRDLVQRLRDQQHRLGELEAGQRSVTAALDLSYGHLSPAQQQAYRRLGLHPGPDFDAHAAAALLGCTPAPAGRVLDQLLEAHLLQEPAPGRYRFHDLTRAHAAGTSTRGRAGPAPEAALGSLLDYYRHAAAAAVDTAYPYERERRPQVPPGPAPGPSLSDPAAALAWLDTELPNLLAAAGGAAAHGRAANLLHLSAVLDRHLRIRGRYRDAAALHQQALAAARAAGDQAGQLGALTGLGDSHLPQGRYAQATHHFTQALQIARATGHRTGELSALAGLGHSHRLQGRYAQAAGYLAQGLQIARATGDRTGEQDALAGLGWIHRIQGRYAQAAHHFTQALQIARATGHRTGELSALTGLGYSHLRQGRYAQATHHFTQALQIARATGHRPAELNALAGLGGCQRMQGRYAEAADHLAQGLQIARATGHRTGELYALTGLGHIHRVQGRYAQAADHHHRLRDLAHESGDRTYTFEAEQGLGRLSHATGHPDTAVTHHEQALNLADELNLPSDQARAHDGLAHAHHALNQYEQARQHWQRALKLLTDCGVDHTEDEEATTGAIRAHLDRQRQRRPPARTCPPTLAGTYCPQPGH